MSTKKSVLNNQQIHELTLLYLQKEYENLGISCEEDLLKAYQSSYSTFESLLPKPKQMKTLPKTMLGI